MGRDVVIVGGGPAGLAAAYEASTQGASASVFECLDIVGGLARTIPFQGSRFDIGPHRFFTKNLRSGSYSPAFSAKRRCVYTG